MAWFVPHGQWRSPYSGGQREACHLSGGIRPPGPDYIGHWRMGMTFREDKKSDRMYRPISGERRPPGPDYMRHCLIEPVTGLAFLSAKTSFCHLSV